MKSSKKYPIEKIVKLQSFWRGYSSRKSTELYQFNEPTDYPTFISGNEKEIKISTKFTEHFVYIGTSGLKNLHLMAQLSSNMPKSSDGYKHIPKMFIIDNSQQVIEFWKTIKQLFIQSKNINEFGQNTQKVKSKLKQICKDEDADNEVLKNIHSVISLLKSENVTPQCPHDFNLNYTFFRNVVTKASFICYDWSNPIPFYYIKQKTSSKVPVIVYASNIPEYFARIKTMDLLVKEPEIEYHLEKIISHITTLKPLLTIYTRTLAGESNLRPTEVIQLNPQEVSRHLAMLKQDKYLDIFQKIATSEELIKELKDEISKFEQEYKTLTESNTDSNQILYWLAFYTAHLYIELAANSKEDYPLALEHLKTAIQKIEEIEETDAIVELKGIIHKDVANIYFSQNQIDYALFNAKKALDFFDQTEIPPEWYVKELKTKLEESCAPPRKRHKIS